MHTDFLAVFLVFSLLAILIETVKEELVTK